MGGYVYVFEMVGTPYYKIGRSINYRIRLKELQQGFPFELKVVYAFKSTEYISLETFLHHKLGSKRYKYEWFVLDKSDLRQIKNLCKVGVELFVKPDLREWSYEVESDRKTTIRKF